MPETAPVDFNPFSVEGANTAAAQRIMQSVRPTGGRQEGAATRFLDTTIPQYAAHVAQGLWDQMALPSREPVPPPAGLMQDDAGRLWIGDKPAHETPEGQAFIADQQARNEWAPGMALSLIGGGGTTAGLRPGSVGIFGGPGALTANKAALQQAMRMESKGVPKTDIWDATGWFRGADDKWRFEIPDTSLGVEPGKGTGIYGPQSRIQHPDLERAYPQMRNITHSVGTQEPKTGGEYTVSRTQGPSVAARGVNRQSARSVAGHELQHIVQEIEGFSPGSEPKQFQNIVDKAMREQGLPPTLSPRNNALAQNAQYEAYHRSAGEVEARNVQTRLDMPKHERSARPPWRTEDIPRDRQIVLKPVDYDPFAMGKP